MDNAEGKRKQKGNIKPPKKMLKGCLFYTTKPKLYHVPYILKTS